ncbi:hypothetical protein [Bifidobacterium miconisargentati]|uniref:hypothetical protein n=1 Tax=Bifidobacterium miconisargentati TaxID=2834437 RepID=UPI001BDC90EE|nr:hypothetical protein [Bifidobacterium miconisargentati]MBW3090724.1 hypothetical protein [Bifidobacterium miconisargentati]
MSRTWKDRPYRVMEAEAEHAGYMRNRYWPLPCCNASEIRLVPDVTAYAYAVGYDAHIPAHHMRDYRWIEDDWIPDYGANHRVREALNAATIAANNGYDMRDWDDPIAYQRRRRWIIG